MFISDRETFPQVLNAAMPSGMALLLEISTGSVARSHPVCATAEVKTKMKSQVARPPVAVLTAARLYWVNLGQKLNETKRRGGDSNPRTV
ncbi:MAG: hypothetical protein AAGM36_20205 [Cyanobacteria bacterium J06597_1]